MDISAPLYPVKLGLGRLGNFLSILFYGILKYTSTCYRYSMTDTIEQSEPNQKERLPIPVRRALSKLGSDIRVARLRRRIPVAIMAQRALVGRITLSKLERGDPNVAMGTYATVLFILGMSERLADIADIRFDPLGMSLDEERLPKRIRTRKVT